MGAGTARSVMTQAGAIIRECHLFTRAFHPVGKMTTGNAAGKATNGTSEEYPINRFRKTGKDGKGTDIGRNKIIGASGACSPLLNHRNNPLAGYSQNSPRPHPGTPSVGSNRTEVTGAEMMIVAGTEIMIVTRTDAADKHLLNNKLQDNMDLLFK